MTRIAYNLLIIFFTGISISESFAKDEVAELCFECHTADNNNPDPIIPKLIGQNKAYLLKEINSFKTGRRADTTMIDIANSITDDKLLLEIIDYYSSQPVMAGTPSNNPLVKKGESLYINRHCEFCHGVRGKVKGKLFIQGAPVIGGQNSEYLYKTLLELRDGTRPTDRFGLMQRSLLQLTSGEIEAITLYLATQ
ncbi:MAG: c-type cytochrome [Candidatus Thiodiazotropha sp. (ex Dulcina madagascariensis)]|nr:c-type cytochrome [Candidatus Thiodiazotropha sp. (ex Dulcina madagascariensis)]